LRGDEVACERGMDDALAEEKAVVDGGDRDVGGTNVDY